MLPWKLEHAHHARCVFLTDRSATHNTLSFEWDILAFSRKLDPKYFTYLAGNFVEFIFHFLEFLYLIVAPRALVTSHLSSSYCLLYDNIDIMDQYDILWNVQMVWITSDYTVSHSRDLGQDYKCYYHLLHININCLWSSFTIDIGK